MSDSGNKYFDDSYCEGVEVKDGKPVRYFSMARRTRDDEPMLAERIAKLTGWSVTFGEWEQLEPVGKDFQSSSEVDLVAICESKPSSRD